MNVIFCTTRAQTCCNGRAQGKVGLSSDYVIDACVFERPEGGYRMWYKDEADRSSTWVVESEDLSRWDGASRAVSTAGGHEGPNVFKFCGAYWMVVDSWNGQVAFRSRDQVNWEGAGGSWKHRTARHRERELTSALGIMPTWWWSTIGPSSSTSPIRGGTSRVWPSGTAGVL